MSFHQGGRFGRFPRFHATRPLSALLWSRLLGVLVASLLSGGSSGFAQTGPGGAPDDDSAFNKPTLSLDAGGHTAAIYKMTLDPNGYQLITCSLDKTVRFWDSASGEPQRVLHTPVGPGAKGYLYCVAISPDSKYLAVSGYRALTPLYDHRIHLISLAEDRIVRSFKGHAYAIYDVEFSPDGKTLASASHDTTVRLWDVETGASRVLKGHSNIVLDVAWSPDGKQIVSGSVDRTGRIWNAAQGTTAAVLTGHTDNVEAVAWSPDGRSVATGAYDRSIRLFEPNGQFRYVWPGLPNLISSLAFSPDSKRLLYTYMGKQDPPVGCIILDMAAGGEVVRHNEHDNSPLRGIFTPDGKQAITGDVVSRIHVWDARTGKTVRKLDGRGAAVYTVGWSRDGQAVAWGNIVDGCNTNGDGGVLYRTFCFRSLDFGPTPDNTYLRARPQLGPMKIGLAVENGVLTTKRAAVLRGDDLMSKYELPQPDDNINCYTLLMGGKAAVGGADGIYLFDVNTGLLRKELMDRGEEVWGMAPSPNFRYLATANLDQIVRVWNVDTETLLVSLFVAGDEWIAWTPEGYYAASLAGESLMGWQINNGPEQLATYYPAAQFHQSLYRPDVIQNLLEMGDLWRTLAMTNEQRKEESRTITLTAVLPPKVSIVQPEKLATTSTSTELKVRAAAEPVGTDAVTGMRLLINGRPWGPAQAVSALPSDDNPAKTDAAQPNAVPAAPSKSAKVGTEWNVALPPGKYEVAVKAETGKSYGLSAPVEVIREAADGSAPARPKLHVLAIAPAPAAAPSAQSVAKALNDNARGPDGRGPYSEVDTKLLTGLQATPEGISTELARLRNTATLGDSTMVYYAGPESIDAGGNYQLGTSVPQGGAWGQYSGTQLKQALAAIPGRMTLMLDTYWDDQQTRQSASGGTCTGTSEAKASTREAIAANDFLRELLTQDYGVSVISAARRTRASMNSSASSSSFSQAFSEGISGRADDNHDGVVQFHELSDYLDLRVPQLSGGKQTPVIERPRGEASFPIAQPSIAQPGAAKARP